MSHQDNADMATVKVSALDGGYLTLPERLFITDADPEKRSTVPSMCFLIEHQPSNPRAGRTTRILLDLGLKRDLSAYEPAMQSHIANRHPITTWPDTAESLRRGGLDPEKDIDIVMFTHVHWDHVGTPTDYPNSQFIVGSGTLHLLEHGAPPHYPAEMFDSQMLPADRTIEFPAVRDEDDKFAGPNKTDHRWKSMFGLSAVLDFFGDGSVLVVDAPGHLLGHINLLVRTRPDQWYYLGGDCCHDIRILRGTKNIALYDDGHGQLRSVHMDTSTAAETIAMIKSFLNSSCDRLGMQTTVEAVVAHDGEWRTLNDDKFLPGNM